MGRRSNFARLDRDAYATIDPRAYPPLLPHLRGVKTFAEPCAGDGHMVRALEEHGLICQWSSDIAEGIDALGFQPRRDFAEGLAELAGWVAQQQAHDKVAEARKELEERGLVA